jgi:phosphodiesterase/alkaline phosphatase D-like protein
MLAAVAGLALTSAGSAGAAGFGFGVAAGEVTSSSAVVWARADQPGTVDVQLATDPRFRRVTRTVRLRASRASDLTVQARITGLRAATAYLYRFRQGRRVSPVGRFRTAPAASANATVEFAITGDADATRVPGTNRPAFNRFEVYARMAAERNDFNVNFGDTMYSDSGVGGPPALTVAQKWAKYRLGLSLPALRRLRGAAGLYSHWDDHEFINDFSRPEHGEEIYRAGVKAFRDYAPVSYSEADGLYRSVRWGRNLELFFLDERSFRSAKASAGGICDLPNGGADLAPTAPQAVRNAFAALAPSLARPVAPACLDRIRDPARTMLGMRQYARFTAAVRASTATFKVILNEVPLQQFYALPYDRWEGYEAERLRLVEFLRTNVRNVVSLSTDTHANLVGDVRLRTLEPPGPLDSGILEVVTGPVATTTFARQIDATLGSPGTGPLLNALFFKPAPPRGIGMACAATDVYSYAQVRVTATTLTITPKDLNGRPVRELSGAPCGPFVVTAR